MSNRDRFDTNRYSGLFHSYGEYYPVIPIGEQKITYNFFNHFHPFVGKFIEQLNDKSISGLFDINFQTGFVSNETFLENYSPNDGTDDSTIQVNDYTRKELELDSTNSNSLGITSPGVDGSGAYSFYNWELFFHVPISVAIHLSKNQRFEEAQKWFHFIFDPTSTDQSIDPPQRFWQFRKFRETSDLQFIDEQLKELSEPGDSPLKNQIINSIETWRNNPFQPHAIARNRFLAYQINVVMKYLDNLISWGDSLFRQDTIESINEATQLYVLAANILGPRPEKIPRVGKTDTQTYSTLKRKLDDFGNAMVSMEGVFPFNLTSTVTKDTDKTSSIFGIARSLHFCIPENDQLLRYWDIVGDSLFKIRHCMNIEGIVRQLPLFQPPIDPGMLVKAAAAGIDISSIVNGLNSSISHTRFPFIIQRALEICTEVKNLGNNLLSILEKKDAEDLALLRQNHEIKILELVEDVKFLQWKDIEISTEALLESRKTTFQRYRHYQLLFGKKEEELVDLKDLQLERTKLTQENFDEIYNELVTKFASAIDLEGYRENTFENGTGSGDGKKLLLNPSESNELNKFMPKAYELQRTASAADVLASTHSLLTQIAVYTAPMGSGGGFEFGGEQLSTFYRILASLKRQEASGFDYEATRSSKTATYQRRIEDWVLQNNLAAIELGQIGKEIISSLIEEQIAKNSYESHKKQIEQAYEIDSFLKDKFTNKDLYPWMQGELSKIYYDSYKFAFDVAKKAEQTMKYELMRKEVDDVNFIKFNYWDSGKKGLLSGEALFFDLKRMEMVYMDNNKTEYELSKNISLQQLDPKSLLELKVNGACEITIPEWVFDIGGAGHYMRRIKTVSLSIPSVSGPNTNVNCTLTLLKSTIRKSPLLKGTEYTRTIDSEDDRFVDYFGNVQSIVTSTAQDDSGLFETNLNGEQRLPFEGAGAESIWRLELPNEFRQFDYDSISDVLLHLRYTARNGGSQIKSKATERLGAILEDASNAGLARSFSLKHDFPTEWHQFVTTFEDFKFTIKKEHFPYFTTSLDIIVNKVELFAIIDGELTSREVTSLDLDDLSTELNDSGQTEQTIAEDADFLTREKNKQVFLAFSYSLEK